MTYHVAEIVEFLNGIFVSVIVSTSFRELDEQLPTILPISTSIFPRYGVDNVGVKLKQSMSEASESGWEIESRRKIRRES